jgi:hypothetical protein
VTESPGRAYVHWLAHCPTLAEFESRIRQVFFRILGVNDASRHKVSVSPSSGVIRYDDVEELWREGAPPPLPTAVADAARAAETFLRKLSQGLDGLRSDLPTELQNVVFVPQTQRIDCPLVPRADADGWDHWLYRAQPMIQVGQAAKLPQGTRAAVSGSAIEVRVGGGGNVISYIGRWRPVVPAAWTTELRPPPQPDEDEAARARGKKPAPPALVYLLDGDGIPQYYLAPYYAVTAGDDQGHVSASPYSLTGEMFWRPHGDGETEVMCVADGGSGRYDYAFASYTLGELFDDGVVIRDAHERSVRTEDGAVDGATARIPNGYHVVMANVRDRQTGAFRHFQRQIVSLPNFQGDGAALVA